METCRSGRPGGLLHTSGTQKYSLTRRKNRGLGRCLRGTMSTGQRDDLSLDAQTPDGARDGSRHPPFQWSSGRWEAGEGKSLGTQDPTSLGLPSNKPGSHCGSHSQGAGWGRGGTQISPNSRRQTQAYFIPATLRRAADRASLLLTHTQLHKAQLLCNNHTK